MTKEELRDAVVEALVAVENDPQAEFTSMLEGEDFSCNACDVYQYRTATFIDALHSLLNPSA